MRELSFGGVDAVVTNINIGDYMIKKQLLDNVTLAGGIDIDAIAGEDLRIGVRRELAGVRDALQSAMDRITPEEYARLQERWVGFTPRAMERSLTPAEQETVVDHVERFGTVRRAVHPAWYPMDFLDGERRHRGVSADLLEELAEQYDIPFATVETQSFQESVEAVADGRADILPAVVPTPELRDKLAFSKPYLSLDMVIATRNSEFFLDGPENLAGRTVSILDMGTLPGSLAQKYPDVSFVPVESVRVGLSRVRNGEDFAFIGSVPTIAYAIKEHNFYNMKIAGRLEESRAVSVAVTPGREDLLAIIEKGLQSMSLEARRDYVDRWISISVEEQVDRTTLWIILAAVALAAALAAVWIRKVHSYNRKLSTAYELLERKNRELAELSITDRLTDLFNRSKLDIELQREVERSNRYKVPFSLIMIDIDWFKQINDDLGHQVGDRVLQEVATRLRQRVRAADILGRWGGEEFLVICPETELAGAHELAETLRRAVADEMGGQTHSVSISLGVSQHIPGNAAEDLIRRTDERLYRAKDSGKNTVIAE